MPAERHCIGLEDGVFDCDRLPFFAQCAGRVHPNQLCQCGRQPCLASRTEEMFVALSDWAFVTSLSTARLHQFSFFLICWVKCPSKGNLLLRRFFCTVHHLAHRIS